MGGTCSTNGRDEKLMLSFGVRLDRRGSDSLARLASLRHTALCPDA
jgi:hypothetical protein